MAYPFTSIRYFDASTIKSAPDPCVPSLCYMSAYLHAFRLHTIYPMQPFDADNGCNNQYSADYCYGWLKAATFFHPHDGNKTRIVEEAWTLGWVHANRQNYNGKHIFYPCSVDNLFCSVYLQGEVQGCRPYRMDSQPSFNNQYCFSYLFGRGGQLYLVLQRTPLVLESILVQI